MRLGPLQISPGPVPVLRRASTISLDPAAFADRFDIQRRYDDVDAMLADDDVDAVYIATPHAEHEAGTVAALTAGKHVVSVTPRRESLEDLFIREVEAGDVGAGAEHGRRNDRSAS